MWNGAATVCAGNIKTVEQLRVQDDMRTRRNRLLLKSGIHFSVQKHTIMQFKVSRKVHGTMDNHIRETRGTPD